MAEELNMHFSSVFTREYTIVRYLYLKQSSIDQGGGERLGQLVVTPEVVASKINNMKDNKSHSVEIINRVCTC